MADYGIESGIEDFKLFKEINLTKLLTLLKKFVARVKSVIRIFEYYVQTG